MSEASDADRSLARFAPVALAVAITVVYAGSLGGGFLNLDDPWLIEQNPLIQPETTGAISKIWLDWSRETRLILGAEYLPMRDMSFWLEARLWGLGPGALRLSNLALYIGACLMMRAALRRTFGGGVTAEAAAWLFALHPVHVESVAWLSGRKDVLAMLFVAIALFVHTGEGRKRIVLVPLLVGLAGLSKAMAISALGLLFAHDLLTRQRPEAKIYVPTGIVCGLIAWVAMQVGDQVGMTTDPLGGSRSSAAAGMGRVWLSYLQAIVYPTNLSIIHDPPQVTTWGIVSIAGWLVILAWGAAGLFVLNKGQARSEHEHSGKPLVLASWIWFVVPLIPVSQIIFPLENFWADRYLFLSVMGPALLAGAFFEIAGDRKALGIGLVLAGGAGLFTWKRAHLFRDSISVLRDAQEKTKHEPLAPYQLGQAYEAAGKPSSAARAYREVLARAKGNQEAARRATNNLAKLLAREGKLKKAEELLIRGRSLWPRDPKIFANLAEVVARQPGREDEARLLYEQLIRHHPHYAPGLKRYQERYGNTERD